VKKRFSEQIIGFLKQTEGGVPVKELARKYAFSDASFYLWRSKFGGMDVSDATPADEGAHNHNSCASLFNSGEYGSDSRFQLGAHR
jgi:hypothetical protein